MPSDLRPLNRTIRLDIAVLADTRAGDAAGPAHAAALSALVEAGYVVGVLPVASAAINADAGRRDPGMTALTTDSRVRELGPGAEVECGLALAFDARLFEGRADTGAAIEAAARVVTVERPAALARLPGPGLARLYERARLALGGEPVWAPTTSFAREALVFAAPHWAVTDDDWAPVAPPGGIAPDADDRARPAIGRARIARSRPDADFPRAALSERLVALRHRVPPGRSRPTWRTAAPMELWPDDTSMSEFLRHIDVLANADAAEDDPCPVEALLALGAGVVPFLPPGCRDVFAGAALYGTEADLARTAVDFWTDPELRTSLRNAGADLLAEVFAPARFVEHVRALAGFPRADPFAPAIHAVPEARVLFYSTNGVGMGHLTRQLAIARRLPARVRPVFLGHSQAVDVARGFGFPAEHIPYHASHGLSRPHWNAALAEAVDAALAFYRPRALVFDGNVPFAGLLDALARHPGVARVWVRRAFWRPDQADEALERAVAFDLVVEPGEVAWVRDDGPTAAQADGVMRVAPVRLLDPDEIAGRTAACAMLGLDPDSTNVLIAVGAGNNFDLRELVSLALDRLVGRSGIGVAVAEWRIASDLPPLPPGAVRLTSYPFAATLGAFDFAIAAAGYNTFAEHVAAGLPTIWVPNENPLMDQQIHRAAYARGAGFGACLRRSEPFELGRLVDRFFQPDTRAILRTRAMREAARTCAVNGAREIAAELQAWLNTVAIRADGPAVAL